MAATPAPSPLTQGTPALPGTPEPPVDPHAAFKPRDYQEQDWARQKQQAEHAFRLASRMDLLPAMSRRLFGLPGALLDSVQNAPEVLSRSLNLGYLAAEARLPLGEAATAYPAIRSRWAAHHLGNPRATEQEVSLGIFRQVRLKDEQAAQQAHQERLPLIGKGSTPFTVSPSGHLMAGPHIVADRTPDGAFTARDAADLRQVSAQAGDAPVYLQSQEITTARKADADFAALPEHMKRPGLLHGRGGIMPTTPPTYETPRALQALQEGRQAATLRHQKRLADLTQSRSHFSSELQRLRTEIDAGPGTDAEKDARREALASQMAGQLGTLNTTLAQSLLEAEKDFHAGHLSLQQYVSHLEAAGHHGARERVLHDLEQRALQDGATRQLTDLMTGSKELFHEGEGGHPLALPANRKLQQEWSGPAAKVDMRNGSKVIFDARAKDSAELDRWRKAGRYSPISIRLLTPEEKAAHLAQLPEHQRLKAEIAVFDEKSHALLDKYGFDPSTREIIQNRALYQAMREMPRSPKEILTNAGFWLSSIPWLGGLYSAKIMAPVIDLTLRLEKGETLAPQEMALLEETLIELERPDSFLATVVRMATDSTSIAVEMYTSAGLATAVRKGTTKVTEEVFVNALKKYATKETRQQVRDSLATRTLAGATGIAAQTLTASLHRVVDHAVTDLATSGVSLSQDELGQRIITLDATQRPGSVWEALGSAARYQFLENTSERLGSALTALGMDKAVRQAMDQLSAPARAALSKQAWLLAIQRANPGKSLDTIQRALTRAHVSSFPIELAEEGGASALHWVFDGEEFALPTAKEAAALWVSMLLTGGTLRTAQFLDSRRAPATAPGSSTAPLPPQHALSTPTPADTSAPRLEFSQGQAPASWFLDLGRDSRRFRRGSASPSMDLPQIVNDYSLSPREGEVVELDYPIAEGATTTYRFDHIKGGHAFIHVGPATVWLQSPAMRGDNSADTLQGGDFLYQAATTYAHNHGLKFIPDPSGVSPLAKNRRISQMLSSAARFGTTRHLQPAGTDWKTDSYFEEVPGWRWDSSPEADAHNMALLAQAELAYVRAEMAKRGQDIDHLKYDPTSDTVLRKKKGTDGSDQWHPLSEGDFKALVAGLDPANSGVGTTTLSRALLIKSTLEGPQPGTDSQGHRDRSQAHRGRGTPTPERAEVLPEGAAGATAQTAGSQLAGGQRLPTGDPQADVAAVDPANRRDRAGALPLATAGESTLEGHVPLRDRDQHRTTPESDRRGKISQDAGSEIYRILGPDSNPKRLFYSQGRAQADGSGAASGNNLGGHPAPRVLSTDVSSADTDTALAALRDAIALDNVLIVDTRDDLNGRDGRPAQSHYHARDWERIHTAEGFVDPHNGQIVLLRRNIQVREGETPALAAARVILHERVGHLGINAVLDTDPRLKDRWARLSAAIPTAELASLRQRYPHLPADSPGLALEWLAHQTGDRLASGSLQPGTLPAQMWQTLRDWVARTFHTLSGGRLMTNDALDAHVRELIHAAQKHSRPGSNSSSRASTTRGGTFDGSSSLNSHPTTPATILNGQDNAASSHSFETNEETRLLFSQQGKGSPVTPIRTSTLQASIEGITDRALREKLERENQAQFDAVRIAKGKLTSSDDVAERNREQKAFVDQFYNKAAYEAVMKGMGNDVVFLAMPSSSGKNGIPRHLARKLKQDFGGIVIEGSEYFFRPGNVESKKNNSYLAKMAMPDFAFDNTAWKDLVKGKRVILVDDIITTGDSLDTLSQMLKGEGIEVQNVISLVAHNSGRSIQLDTVKTLMSQINAQLAGHAVQNSPIYNKGLGNADQQRHQLLSWIVGAHGKSRDALLKKAIDDASSSEGALAVLKAIRQRYKKLNENK